MLAAAAFAASGGAMAQATERSGEQIVRQQCASCHQEGVYGAPRIDDRTAWAPRLKRGLDATVRSAIRGHGKMPARGGMADLTDTELRAAIAYMFYPDGAVRRPSAAPAPARDSHHQIVGNTEIFLGIVPASRADAQHPGAPSGKGYYHVNVSLRDATTKAEIKDAQVDVRVASALAGATKKMELMTFNDTTSYGNYFRITGTDPYTITVQVRRRQMQPIEAKFDFKQ